MPSFVVLHPVAGHGVVSRLTRRCISYRTTIQGIGYVTDSLFRSIRRQAREPEGGSNRTGDSSSLEPGKTGHPCILQAVNERSRIGPRVVAEFGRDELAKLGV